MGDVHAMTTGDADQGAEPGDGREVPAAARTADGRQTEARGQRTGVAIGAAIGVAVGVVEGEFDIEPLRACRRRHAHPGRSSTW